MHSFKVVGRGGSTKQVYVVSISPASPQVMKTIMFLGLGSAVAGQLIFAPVIARILALIVIESQGLENALRAKSQADADLRRGARGETLLD